MNPKRDIFWSTLNGKGYHEAINEIYGRLYNIKYYIKKLLKK